MSSENIIQRILDPLIFILFVTSSIFHVVTSLEYIDYQLFLSWICTFCYSSMGWFLNPFKTTSSFKDQSLAYSPQLFVDLTSLTVRRSVNRKVPKESFV